MEKAGDIATAQALLYPLGLGSVKWAGPALSDQAHISSVLSVCLPSGEVRNYQD